MAINLNELLAVNLLNNGKYLIVVYKETDIDDGFVITAFITSRMEYLNKKEVVWKKK
jgi:hypothetical protein